MEERCSLTDISYRNDINDLLGRNWTDLLLAVCVLSNSTAIIVKKPIHQSFVYKFCSSDFTLLSFSGSPSLTF